VQVCVGQVELVDVGDFATNLRAILDEAFTRRLDWVRRSPDVDLSFLADSFELAGGSIRSSAITAAYLAAADSGVIGMRHLVGAIHREYRKLGRLCRESEFGPYWSLVKETA